MVKKAIVKIPNVAEEVRIGYSFNYLVRVIAETEAAEAVQWDFAGVTFLHPFFLAPLSIYKNTSGKDIECINIPLRNLFRWQGTVILMRIPVVLPDGFNYIDYLE